MRTPKAVTVMAWAVALFLIFYHLGRLPLLDPDEGRNAEVAREMKDTHSFLTPTYDGLPYLDKPAFYFDVVAVSFTLFGENETAARLPSAIFAVLTLLLVFLFCRRVYGLRTASLAVLVLGTTPLFFAFARLVIFDMALTFFVCAALFAGFLALEAGSAPDGRRYYAVTALATAFAVLVKGPVGLVLPLLGLLAYARVAKRIGGRLFFAPANLLIFFLPVLAWFLGVSVQRPDFPYYGIVRETLSRLTSSSEFHRSAPWYYYFPVIVGVFFPWSMLLPELAVRGWQNRSRAAEADKLLAVFVIVVVVFFSLSQSKLPGYVLPGLVALSILVARVFDLALRDQGSQAGWLISRGTLLLALVSGATSGVFATQRYGTASLFASIHSRQFVRAQVLFLPLILVLTLTAAAALGARLSGSIPAMMAAYVLVPVLLLAISGKALDAFAESESSRGLAQSIRGQVLGKPEVICYRCFPPGLPFYLKRTIGVITDSGRETTSNYIVFTLAKDSQWPTQMVHLQDSRERLSTTRAPVLLLARAASAVPNQLIRSAPWYKLAPEWKAVLLRPQESH